MKKIDLPKRMKKPRHRKGLPPVRRRERRDDALIEYDLNTTDLRKGPSCKYCGVDTYNLSSGSFSGFDHGSSKAWCEQCGAICLQKSYTHYDNGLPIRAVDRYWGIPYVALEKMEPDERSIEIIKE